jgi:hypothetical protein
MTRKNRYKSEFFVPLFTTAKNLLKETPTSKFFLCFAKRYPTQDTQIQSVAKDQHFLLSNNEEFDYKSLNIQNLLIRDDLEKVYIQTFTLTSTKTQ